MIISSDRDWLGGSLVYLNDRLSEWSQKTFGSDTERSPQYPANHLILESKELAENPNDETECADCLILLLDINRRAGRTLEDLLIAAHNKQDINEKRTWGKPDENGVIRHTNEE